MSRLLPEDDQLLDRAVHLVGPLREPRFDRAPRQLELRRRIGGLRQGEPVDHDPETERRPRDALLAV